MEKIKSKAKQLKKVIPALFLVMKKEETPLLAKVVAGITVVYALSPIDLIPDFVPVLGYLDDLIILPLLAAIAIKLIPKHILEDCMVEADEIWRLGKPKKWFYALPIIFIWSVLIVLILRLF